MGSKTKTLAKQIMFNSVSMYRICDAHEHTDAVRNSIRLCDFHCGGARLWPSCVSRVKARHLVTHDGLAQHKEKQNSIEFELSLSWARSRWPGNFVMSPWHRVRGSAPQTFEVNKKKKKSLSFWLLSPFVAFILHFPLLFFLFSSVLVVSSVPRKNVRLMMIPAATVALLLDGATVPTVQTRCII